ncbi:hypothetical protein VNI00_010299 [Paramarasmius palmivorus]|uniref:F-box domain-containing protein n=1 Tax=Paramarasmius palmivorus TaxID=297713 RepID=A0AAW0CL36_9AGAR
MQLSDSEANHLLRSGYRLSESQAQAYRTHLASTTKKCPERSLYQALLSPIRRLPPELLSRIFVLTDSTAVVAPRKCESEAMVIASVCAYWHTISMHTSEMWGNILLKITSGVYPRDILTFFELHLERARLFTVALGLEGCEDIEEWRSYFQNAVKNMVGPSTTQERLLKVMMQHADRIQSFCIGCSGSVDDVLTEELLLPFLNHYVPHFRSLENLEFIIFTLRPVAHLLDPFSSFSGLKRIHLSHIDVPDDLALATLFPFENLTSLEVSWTSTAVAAMLLQRCPNLTTASFGIACLPSSQSKDTLVLQHLQSLTISLDDDEWSPEILGLSIFIASLKLSSLRQFTLLGVEDPSDNHPFPKSFIPSITHLLTNVEVFHIERVDVDLASLLAGMLRLRELVIGGTGETISVGFLRKVKRLKAMRLLLSGDLWTKEHTNALAESGIQSLYIELNSEKVDLDVSAFGGIPAARVVQKQSNGEMKVLMGYDIVV